MNTENILAVADAIEQHTISWLGFNMNTFMYDALFFEDKSGYGCGTCACVAGWTAAVATSATEPKEAYDWSFIRAADWLGLNDDEQIAQLFYASNHPKAEHGVGPLNDLSPRQAVRTLRHLAATGEVDWEV